MSKSILLTSVTALLVAATPVLAGGVVPVPAAPAAIAPIAPAGTDWTGAYAGLQLEYGSAEILNGPPDPDFDGTLFGGFVGYRYDFGTIVVGAEVDYVIGELTSTSPGTVESFLRAGVELGYDAGPALVYATAGWVQAGLEGPGGNTFDELGHFYGVGLDYLLRDNIVLGVEVLHHDFNEISAGPPPPQNLTATTFGLNVAFRF